MYMKTGRAGYYFLFGGLFFLFWFLFKMGGMQDMPLSLLSTTVDVVVTMAALVLVVEYLLPGLLYRKKWALFALCFFSLVLMGGSLVIMCQLRLQGRSLFSYRQDIVRYKHYYYWFWADLVFGSYFMTFFIPATGAAIRLSFRSIESSRRVEKLEKEQALSELELLKHQINPHFLFNALNTIYYKIDRSNRPAREILQQFSQMLRYQLYECDKAFVDIANELQFIRQYIELQQQRLNDNYTVRCEGFEEVKGLTLSPFLLMPLVENCFKHVSSYADRMNTIIIRCSREGESFLFCTRNSIAPDAPERGGIGLLNIRRRLELLYPGRHALTTRQTSDHYEAILKLEC
ncbi:MAG: hypothetical protein BGO55_12220 [Sphingobacteriales bacterium 50-39]|nr:MAG: hypothetical protein BGO55_12220 [Sphingobacteriales bacterium 50-39]